MFLDCTLNELTVPGISGVNPPFGTKKQGEEKDVTAREADVNARMPFSRQRPYHVSEESVTSAIEAHSAFVLETAGITLTLGEGGFVGCAVKVFNTSDGVATAEWGADESAELKPGTVLKLEWSGTAWRQGIANETLPGVVRSGGDVEVDPEDGKMYVPSVKFPARFIVSSGKREVRIKAGTYFVLKTGSGERKYYTGADTELDIATILDDGTLQGGKDYYLFLCAEQEGGGTVFAASLNKDGPQGYQAGSFMLIGGFHTLCADAGTGLTYVYGGVTMDHPLNGFVAGDILPASVWCLNHRPYSEPEGMVYIESLDFWCDIYLQSGSGFETKSAYQGAITRNRQYVDFVEDQFCVRKELLDDGEFAAAALGSNEQTAVLGASETGATSGGAGGRKDTANRRMISIYGVEEGCGSLLQWLRSTSAGGMAGSVFGQTSATPAYGTITVTTSANGPYSQSGGKGSFWGLAVPMLAGGDWGSGANCGSRARNAYTARSGAAPGRGGRGRSRAARI